MAAGLDNGYMAIMKQPLLISGAIRIFVLGCTPILPLFLAGFIAMPQTSIDVPFEASGRVDVSGLMTKVLQLNKEDRHQKAIDLILAAIENQREDSLLRTLLVQTFELYLEDEARVGRHEIGQNKEDVDAYARVATALELLGRDHKAMSVLLTGVARNPQAADLWMKIGHPVAGRPVRSWNQLG